MFDEVLWLNQTWQTKDLNHEPLLATYQIDEAGYLFRKMGRLIEHVDGLRLTNPRWEPVPYTGHIRLIRCVPPRTLIEYLVVFNHGRLTTATLTEAHEILH